MRCVSKKKDKILKISSFEKMEIIVILNYLKKIDTIFKKAIVYEGIQYGGKQNSVGLLVKNLEI